MSSRISTLLCVFKLHIKMNYSLVRPPKEGLFDRVKVLEYEFNEYMIWWYDLSDNVLLLISHIAIPGIQHSSKASSLHLMYNL
jgi:hypothetical protein